MELRDEKILLIKMNFILVEGVFDKNNKICSSLLKWCRKHQDLFVSKEFIIKKGTHSDLNGEYHFTFSNNNKSYHAYVIRHLITINGTSYLDYLKITRITSLQIFY